MMTFPKYLKDLYNRSYKTGRNALPGTDTGGTGTAPGPGIPARCPKSRGTCSRARGTGAGSGAAQTTLPPLCMIRESTFF